MTTQPEALRLAERLERYDAERSGYAKHCHAAAAELRRLHHNNLVMTNALWKACGDDKNVVNATIKSQGELK